MKPDSWLFNSRNCSIELVQGNSLCFFQKRQKFSVDESVGQLFSFEVHRLAAVSVRCWHVEVWAKAG